MNKTIMLFLLALASPAITHAACLSASCAIECAQGMRLLPFNVKMIVPPMSKEENNPRTPVLVPTVYADGQKLHFQTPCEGMTVRLVKDGVIIYEAVVTSLDLYLPDYTDICELQLIRDNYMFYTEINL